MDFFEFLAWFSENGALLLEARPFGLVSCLVGVGNGGCLDKPTFRASMMGAENGVFLENSFFEESRSIGRNGGFLEKVIFNAWSKRLGTMVVSWDQPCLTLFGNVGSLSPFRTTSDRCRKW